MKREESYNWSMNRIKRHLSANPGQSKYQIAKAMKSDPRTVSNLLGVMINLDHLDEEKVEVGAKTYTNYFVRDSQMKTKQVNVLAEWLDQVAAGKNGYRFGQFWRHTDKSLGGVMPIIQESNKEVRHYVMMEELKDEEHIILTDTGEIDRIKVKSKAPNPVFVRMGTAFKGDTQERAADTSVIIMPTAEEQEITVKCVHASKGIVAGASFMYAGSVPHDVERGFASAVGQSETWSRVQSSNRGRYARMQGMQFKGRSLSAQMPAMDNLVGATEAIKEFKKESKNILKNIPSVENQVGVIIFDQKGILSVELFDHPDSWKAFHQAIYEKYEDILAEEQEEALFQIKPETVPKLIKAFFLDMKSAQLNLAKSHSRYKTWLMNKTVIGEITELDGKLIHALGIRKDQVKDNNSTPNPFRTPGVTLGSLGGGVYHGPARSNMNYTVNKARL